MSYRYLEEFKARARAGQKNPLMRLLRRILIRLPEELIQWIKAFKTLKAATMLVIPGLGMLGDFGARPLGLHYEILKWSIIAKLRGCKLLFVSVGAGRLHHPLSRRLIRSALSLADYRSYRDSFSKECLHSIGVDTRGDFVYPDLAFSLPRLEPASPPRRKPNGRVIGLGLMEYYGKGCSREHGEHIYHAYLENVAAFAGWLLGHNYTVRLLIGDLVYDRRVKQDVINRLTENGSIHDESQLINEPVSSVEELRTQLATTDMVVATRFHNILLALMLNKPAISISYDTKNDSLMAAVGLAEYCQDIDHLDVHKLVEQFVTLEGKTEILKPHIQQKTEEYRGVLDEQYRSIFNGALSS